MPGAHSHKVRLVGTDGQEQPIIFDIESEGVHLLSQKAQVSFVGASLHLVCDNFVSIIL